MTEEGNLMEGDARGDRQAETDDLYRTLVRTTGQITGTSAAAREVEATREGAGSSVAPDAITPIVGYRLWLVVNHLGRKVLESLHDITRWPPGKPLEARGNTPRFSCPHAQQAPVEKCSCGIYAYNSVTDALRHASPRVSLVIRGEVELWGKVIEYDEGYRAQYARVSALWGRGRTARRLARLYDVPLKPLKEVRKLAWEEWAS